MKRILLLSIAFMLLHHAESALVRQPVSYEDRGTKLQGYLAYDDAQTTPGKSAGILVVPEWWGVNAYVKSRADQVAQLGYVAFVADMYGDGKSTEDPKEAQAWSAPFHDTPLMAERAQAGLDQLLKSERVDQKKLGAIGFCFGGSTVEALAYTGAPLTGIVAFHGGPVDAPASAAGKVKAKFLLLNGGADKMVTSQKKAELAKSLKAAGIDFRSIDYPGALHAFTNPDADRIAHEHGMVGMIGYNEAAAHKSWAEMQTFFRELFAKQQ